ncbi:MULTISPECIES: hypothetical protein [Streptomyces]|uniref:hypothetical protein n=1 Tax=Streptomyces TaxID=1883 RepID=UPI00140671CE|nr:hypothetical protein [Streptomyces sennicomposti]MBY8868080.1 hypothetical protein [Streptomyces sennicomposti]NED72497.1 hypothetical protein [Streptomyces sp. SID9944]
MGRVGRRSASFQVSSRLTWTFSARAGLGHSRAPAPGPPRPVTTASRIAATALLRSLLRAARPRARVRARSGCVRRGRRR